MAVTRRRRTSVTFTPHRKVLRHIDALLATGLYGRSRSELALRLVCEGIAARVGHPRFRLGERDEKEVDNG